ncbi:neuroglobin-like protein [Leptotrombidium deliense]|uniref:Neuroglobin-like protein n=1 Tax=Leptotrombidium deliense TaxID=299467 RepID=A0A443SQH2_9ACAR|nr:neuroglobin-like protein [Leptotrombidium deliense]
MTLLQQQVQHLTFPLLFETHPDVQQMFLPLRSILKEDLKYSKELRAHALRVMGYIQKVVARLKEPEKCEQLLQDLGKRHVTYGAKVEYIDLVGQQFIYAIKPSLEAVWSEAVEDSWNQFKCPCLTEAQKLLIENTWKMLVDNISRVGVITFMRLFETHPEVQEVFMPFREIDKNDLKFSKELRAHALRVMGIVQKVVARIQDSEKCEQLLRDLGKKHIVYGAKVDYVDLVGPQFIYAIKPSLESVWNEEVEQSWNTLFKFIAFVMKKAMKDVE